MNDLTVICGGTGFLGRALLADLKAKGHTNLRVVARSIDKHNHWKSFHDQRNETIDGVFFQSADLSNANQALGAVRDARYVYNLAASVGGIHFIQKARADCMLAARININLLQACREVGVQKYFYASSACVYPSSDEPISEEYAHPARPERGYGWEKLFGEQMCREYRESGYVETRVGRLFTLYGPGDNKDCNHFPAALCKKIAQAKFLQNKEIELWGDGTQVRSLLFIDDAVEGIQQITHSGYGDPINLSGDEYATVNQMVDLVQGIAGTDVGVKYKGGTTGVQSRISKNTRCRLKLGWEPSVGLKEGFEKTWRYWWDLTLRELGGTTH